MNDDWTLADFRRHVPSIIAERDEARAERDALHRQLAEVEATAESMSNVVFGDQAEGAWYVLDAFKAALSGPGAAPVDVSREGAGE